MLQQNFSLNLFSCNAEMEISHSQLAHGLQQDLDYAEQTSQKCREGILILPSIVLGIRHFLNFFRCPLYGAKTQAKLIVVHQTGSRQKVYGLSSS